MLACGVLAVAPAAHAQARESGRMSTPLGVAQIGLEGGWTISNFVGNELDNDSNRNGGYGGLTFIIQPNTSPIGFQTGVLYVQKGAKSSFSSGGGSTPVISGGVKLTYIEVPAMIRIGVPLSLAGAAPTIVGGASLGWRVDCRAIIETGSNSASRSCDDALLNEDLDTKRFDLGATVGVELPIKVGERGLIVPTVRYVRGMTRISDVNGNDTKNSSVMIGLGLRFR
jgi:Outer membrane protein beta-barrel domain